MSEAVQIVEVGARDGLQNEAVVVSTADKLALLRRLVGCGLRRIEATACVSARRVAQMADYPAVLAALGSLPPARWSVLVANERGMRAALAAGGVGEVALFTAASDAFAERNISCSVAESLRRFAPLAAMARGAGVRVRGYISTVVACPYAGRVRPAAVAAVAAALAEMGCDEISLGETLGVAEVADIRAMLAAVGVEVGVERLAAHFHDTYGRAIGNIACALDAGVRVVDSSIGGLGGCPFAPGAGGNAATESVVAFLESQGCAVGVDAEKLAATAAWIRGKI